MVEADCSLQSLILCESPDYVRTSLAAAMTLKLIPGRFYRDAKLYCINLLLTYPEGCAANCAYCGLSRERGGRWVQNSFIRVDWPTYPLNEIIDRMEEYKQDIRRVCVSMITRPKAVADTIQIVKRIRERLDTPISALITPTVMSKRNLEELKQAGCDHIGVAVDAARPDLFDKYRGSGVKGPHKWDKYWEIVKQAVEVYGDAVGVHLIVGLGETEKEMIETIQHAQNIGASTHLFSFYPEENSQMSNHQPPPIEQYRRIQLARYLINEKIKTIEDMEFTPDGRLESINISVEEFDKIVESGIPFMTSGCPGVDGQVACNRPYANEKPGKLIRNYPFKPLKSDIKIIRKQLKVNVQSW
ncbi:MAG: radical SAM protein [Candidatus Odinarchaeum yellowstonii]|uniref:Radical SAM protein n=1 Tax=Odinarchaeota yellowstonii (strain LCB_4) TaxID=1841599 RepID=A0AAF0D236_ODILC|nr:MAG: radical SAM protein [Candidatus Odinarchaeum yellowstonii]